MHRHDLNHPEFDQWAPIIRAQANASKLAEEDESRRKKLSKQLYKDELAKQLEEKRLREQEEEASKQAETELIRKKVQAVQEYDLRAKQDLKLRQHMLAQEYASKSSMKAMQAEQERAEWLASEQARLQRIEALRAEEAESRKAMKERTLQEEKKALERKQEEKAAVLRSLRMAKLKEQEDIQANIKSQLKKEQEWRDSVAERLRKLEKNASVFESTRKAQEERKIQELELEKNWKDTMNARAAEEEANRELVKQNALRSTNQLLGLQLQMRDSIQGQQLREKEYERQETIRRVEELQQEERERKLRQQKERELLSQTLSAQVALQKERETDKLRMSGREKQFNQDLMRDNLNASPMFYAVPGINLSESPLKKVMPLAFRSYSHQGSLSSRLPNDLEGAAKQFYGATPAYKKLQLDLAYDPQKHDPIANPIGYSHRSSDSKSFFRGRGLAALSNAK